MAGPGFLAPPEEWDANWEYQIYPADATPIGEHELGETPGFEIGGWENYLWYKFVPSNSGVVSIDLYLTTIAGSESQVGVEAYSDTLYEDAPGWRHAGDHTDEWGGPDEYLARYFGIVEAGVPVIFDIYAYAQDPDTGDYFPTDVRVRISDVLPLGDAPREEGPVVSREFVSMWSTDGFGVADSDSPAIDARQVDGIQIALIGGHAHLGYASGDADRALAGEALRLARKGHAYPTVANTGPVIYPASPQGPTFKDVGWTDGTLAGSSIDGDRADPMTVRADSTYTVITVGPYQSAMWAWYELEDVLGGFPQATDTLALPAGDAREKGVAIKSLKVAPDVAQRITDPAKVLPYSGPMKWVITPSQPRQIAPELNHWGYARFSDEFGSVAAVANQSGPESLLQVPGAQVIDWSPTAPASYTEVTPELFETFLDVEYLEQSLTLTGMTQAQLSDTNPAPESLVLNGLDDITDWQGMYGNVRLHMRMEFARAWQPIPKPELWVDEPPAITGRLKDTRRRFGASRVPVW